MQKHSRGCRFALCAAFKAEKSWGMFKGNNDKFCTHEYILACRNLNLHKA